MYKYIGYTKDNSKGEFCVINIKTKEIKEMTEAEVRAIPKQDIYGIEFDKKMYVGNSHVTREPIYETVPCISNVGVILGDHSLIYFVNDNISGLMENTSNDDRYANPDMLEFVSFGKTSVYLIKVNGNNAVSIIPLMKFSNYQGEKTLYMETINHYTQNAVKFNATDDSYDIYDHSTSETPYRYILSIGNDNTIRLSWESGTGKYRDEGNEERRISDTATWLVLNNEKTYDLVTV